MEVRYSAKGLITTEDDKYIFVAGRRGMFNLPGGGVEGDETNIETLFREVEEETGIKPDQLSDIHETFSLQGEVAFSDRVTRLARWTIFTARADVSSDDLYIPDHSEVTAITGFTAEQCMVHHNMSILAKQALQSYLG